ncbi:queuosine precursor transporter [Rickettsiales endosymbiont of Stachyamoeba lipophora]|uniref:queuosine precursor transporter n=1 Tax=Rickettsiales endosymbiont of Stachyamoeba lipophora TaxID=2486578 RepID=UPI000F64EF42|nr:queuosine precursor transporter [Rickettsiales endosymbiont of Stachyamoeba lipophora]AZL15484.1 VUT family protein [Rickettsiales endosymbiont of Stachyamoeba lipophora]
MNNNFGNKASFMHQQQNFNLKFSNENNSKISLIMLIIALLYTVVLVISNITSNKLVLIYGYVFDAGFLFFPFTYVMNDILTEVYGFTATRKIIWSGLLINILASLMIYIVTIMPPLDEHAANFDKIFASSYRIFAASIVSYIIGEFINSMVMSKSKVKFKGSFFKLRSIASTSIGVICESIIFFIIAFLGLIDHKILWQMLYTQVVIKIMIASCCSPISFKIVSLVKQLDKIDIYDYKLKYKWF